jgi:hypothetical protein
MDLNYPSIHADKEYEYSLSYTYDTQERCYMSVTQKCSRITDKVEIVKDGDKWYYGEYPLDPVMQLMAEWYYKQARHEEDCAFIGFPTEKSKKKQALENVKSVISQEFDLDKQFQINSFGGRK